MIAEIIPYAKLPRNLSVFDYTIPDEKEFKNIKLGQIVTINFRGRLIPGLIFKIKEKSEFPKLKKIKSAETNIILDQKQVNLLNILSDYYFTSPASFLKEFIPAIPKKIHQYSRDWSKYYDFKIQKDLRNYENVKTLLKELEVPNRRYLVLSNKTDRKLSFYLKYLEGIIKADKDQVLLLFPNLKSINEFLEFIPAELLEKISVLTSKVYNKKNLFYKEWLDIKENKTKIIISNRSGLFLPLGNVKTIIIDQAEHQDYKQEEQNPRYHAVDLAYLTSKENKIKLIISSLCPRLLDYYLSQVKNDFKLINDWQNIKDTSHWIDSKNQSYDEKLHPVITEEAERAIIKSLEKKENVLLLHNKKGLTNQITCTKCKHVFNCPDCQSLLFYNKKGNNFHCSHCKKVINKLYCPKCDSKEWKTMSYGTEHLKNHFSEKHSEFKVINIEQNKYTVESLEKLINKIKKQEDNYLIIATNYIFSLLDLKYFKTIVISNTDRILSSNDFNANWKTFSAWPKLIHYAAEKDIQIYLQTYNINHYLFQSLKKHKYLDFYKNELEWRKMLAYPPYKQLIKLIYQNTDKDKGEMILKKHYKKLQAIMNKNSQISSPYPIYHASIRRKSSNTYRWIISIKSNYSNLKKDTELAKYLISLGTEWLIDLNPENLYR